MLVSLSSQHDINLRRSISARTLRRLLQQIRARPHKIVQRNSAYDRLLARIRRPQELVRFLQTYDRQAPLCLLLECIGKDCPLNRVSTKTLRARCAQSLVLPPARSQIRYLSLGSGALLQDLFFITKLILESHPAELAIILIDPLYADFIENYKGSASHQSPLQQTVIDLHAYRFSQFLRWCKSLAPTCTITLSIAATGESYKKNHPDYQADIVTAIDSGLSREECIDFCRKDGQLVYLEPSLAFVQQRLCCTKKSRLSR